LIFFTYIIKTLKPLRAKQLFKMNSVIIFENYTNDNKLVHYIEQNSYITFSDDFNKKNTLTVFFNDHHSKYFESINAKYNGCIKKCVISYNGVLYTTLIELYDQNVLEFLTKLYENQVINNYNKDTLYNDYLHLYNNQFELFEHDNEFFI